VAGSGKSVSDRSRARVPEMVCRNFWPNSVRCVLKSLMELAIDREDSLG
jgi:hypothetical protein